MFKKFCEKHICWWPCSKHTCGLEKKEPVGIDVSPKKEMGMAFTAYLTNGMSNRTWGYKEVTETDKQWILTFPEGPEGDRKWKRIVYEKANVCYIQERDEERP